jgi:hypothetical protein
MTTALARENREYIRDLLWVRQPQFAAALESAVEQILQDHETVCGQAGVPDDRRRSGRCFCGHSS